MENKVEIVKLGTGLVVGLGIESIISNAVKDTTPGGNSRLNKVCTWMGVMVLTGMIADKAWDYTDKRIDDLVDYINKTMVKVKEELK